jgi:ribosomal protein S18 acetylase RimI-like enzyme
MPAAHEPIPTPPAPAPDVAPEGFTIEPLRATHVPAIVDVHMRAFPRFFLTFLGPRFLREFYASFLVDPAGVGLAAVDSRTGRVVGVVVGPVSPDGYFQRLLKRRWWAFALASAAAVLRRPTVIRRLLRAVFYRGESPPGPPRALLSSLAVAPEAQGHGVGRALVRAWVRSVRRRGATGCCLTTDAQDNDPVNRFYQGLDWKIETTYTTRQGRAMNRYVLDVPAEPAGPGDRDGN